MRPKAVVLLSGGLDSATAAALAGRDGFAVHGLTARYGQRHAAELAAAERVAAMLGAAEHRVVAVDLGAFGGSALTSDGIDVPEPGTPDRIGPDIPVTYVPARNTVLLALALAWAEVLGSSDLFIGVNALDYSGYPDCRPEFVEAFQALAALATRAGVEGQPVKVHAPLMAMTKAEVIAAGTGLGIDYGQTVSCYQADGAGRACGACDACVLRRQGFAEAGVADPTRYRAEARA